MLRDFARPIRRAFQRRVIAGVTLLAYLAATIGYPLPAGARGQQVCGCVPAEKCSGGGCGCSHKPAPVKMKPSCCAKKSACCEKKSGNTPNCCAKKPVGEARQAKNPKPVQWVIGIAAKQCRTGGVAEWQSGEIALPGAPPMTWSPSWSPCGIVPFVHSSPFVVASESPDPPPRSVAL